MKAIIKQVENFAKKNSESDDIHGFPHVLRVKKLAIEIGIKVGANLQILEFAALLHDIGRIKEKTDAKKRNHAIISADMALRFLKSENFNISEEFIENVIHCIKAHSFSNNIKPCTLEAKVLSDADKIDALGAIGIYRTIGFTVKKGGGINDVINHLEQKIMRLIDLLYLEESKKLAMCRHQYVIEFYQKIKKEI